MSCKYLIIIICLMVILYLYNKNQTFEKLEHFDDSVINQIASITNGEKVVLKNVDITGELKVNQMNPLKDTIKMNNVDISKQLILPKNTTGTHIQIDNIEANNLTSPNITTRVLSSTKKDGDYINFNTNIYSPYDNLLGTISSGNEKSKRTTIYFNNNVEFNGDKSLKSKNIYTQYVRPGYSDWVNFPGKVDLQSTFRLRGDDIKGTTKVMAGKQSWLTW